MKWEQLEFPFEEDDYLDSGEEDLSDCRYFLDMWNGECSYGCIGTSSLLCWSS